MPKTRIPSPSRSQGNITPRRNKTRKSRSVCSPAPSNASGRLTSLIDQFKDKNMEFFSVSPMKSRWSVLTDNTDIDEPRRKSWWKNLNENSQDFMEVLEDNKATDSNISIENISDIEVISQENKNYTSLDLPESSDNESIQSIVIPQRKLFTQKENKPQKKFGQIIGARETLTKMHKSNTTFHDKTITAGTKDLFQGTKKTKPVFSAVLLNITANKTTVDKTMENIVAEPQVAIKNIFGNRQAKKRKNIFADFIVSDSEHEISDIQVQAKHSLVKRSKNDKIIEDQPNHGQNIDIASTEKQYPEIDYEESVEENGHESNEENESGRNENANAGSELHNEVVECENDENGEDEDGKNESADEISEIKDVNNENEILNDKSEDSKMNGDENELGDENEIDHEQVGTKANDDENELGDEHEVASDENERDDEQAGNKANDVKNVETETNNENVESGTNDDENEDLELNYDERENSKSDDANEKNLGVQPKLMSSDNVINESPNDTRDTTEKNITEIKSPEIVLHNKTPQQISFIAKGRNTSVEATTLYKTLDVRPSDDENELDNEKEVAYDENEIDDEQAGSDDEHELDAENEVAYDENEIDDEQAGSDDEHELDAENEVASDDNEIDNEQAGSDDEHELDAENEVATDDNEIDDEQVGSEVNDDENVESETNDDENVESETNDDENVQSETNDDDENMESEINDDDENMESETNDDENVENDDRNVESETNNDDEELELNYDARENSKSDDANEDNVDGQSKVISSDDVIDESPNVTHDTTGRNRKKVKSSEIVLHDKTQQISFIAKGRNTSIREAKTMYKDLEIRPSFGPPRDSLGLSAGNSSAEGSGWDSHRTTRKTLRQTFGKDFTPRKSLRALVMEKSAKQNVQTQSDTVLMPLANSTEFPQDSNCDVDLTMESDHEVSKRTRQTTLEAYLEKIKQQNIEKKLKMEEAIRNSLKDAPKRDPLSLFKVPSKPAPRKPKAAANKPKKQKISTLFGELPSEVIEDMKYKPPKRFKPSNASWITKRLYKYLENKLEAKYDYKARVRAEKLVETIYQFTKDVRRHKTAPTHAVDVLKHEFARLDIVSTHFEFYEFFHEFMPREVRVKVNPDIVNKIPLPRHGVFSDILRGNTVQG